MAAVCTFYPRKRLEQPGLLLQRYARAGVLHTQLHRAAGGQLQILQHHIHPPLLRELDGVTHEVDENLTERAPVGEQQDIDRRRVHRKSQALAPCLQFQCRRHFFDQGLAVHGLQVQRDLVGAELGHIQQIVDERQQVLGARLHDAQLLFLLGIQRSRQLHEQHAGKADDGVEGRAQLVGHAGQKTVFHQGRVLQLQVLVPQHLFDALALRHITNGAGDKQALLCLQRVQADLDRELAAVLAQAVQLQPSPHGAGAWFGKKIAPVVRVAGAEALGHQQLDGLAQQLVAAPAEQFHRLRVDEDDVPLPVDDDHGVRRGLQQVLELLVGALAVGDVADGTHHHGALFGVDGAQADLDRKLSTILAQAMQLQPRPHGAGARLAKKAAAVAQVGAAVAVGQQHLHRLPQQFSTG